MKVMCFLTNNVAFNLDDEQVGMKNVRSGRDYFYFT